MKTLDENASIGERIRFYRLKRNMTCDTLAELVGLSRYAIMYYENGQTEPSLEDLKKIASALGIEADKLFDDYYRFLDYPYSERIKQIRVEHHLRQRGLGELLGVIRRTVERWEHGKHIVDRATWEQLKTLNLIS
jgi:transcriptional regulator with XRE-family HTH domain